MFTHTPDTLLSILTVSASDYSLFLSDEDPRKGIWLESGRTLDYYMLRNGVEFLSHTGVFICGVLLEKKLKIIVILKIWSPV